MMPQICKNYKLMMKKHTVHISPKHAFSMAYAELTGSNVVAGNVTAMRLNEGFSRAAENAAAQVLHKMGQKRLVALTHRPSEAQIALAYYAGNGVVVKVIPKDFLGQPESIYHAPAISSETIEANERAFVVRTYP